MRRAFSRVPRHAGVAILSRCCVCTVLLALSACANDQAARQTTEPMRPPQAQVARAPEVEDDGLPPQVAPRNTTRQEPDDPSEPFSPNYGNPSYGATSPPRRADAYVPSVADRAPPSRVPVDRVALNLLPHATSQAGRAAQ